MAPTSFVAVLPAEIEGIWQQRLLTAGITLAADEELSATWADDLDVVFIGRMRTPLGEFPIDVTRPDNRCLFLQVYFGHHREQLQALIEELFPESKDEQP